MSLGRCRETTVRSGTCRACNGPYIRASFRSLYHGCLLSRLASTQLGLSVRTSAWCPIWLLALPPVSWRQLATFLEQHSRFVLRSTHRPRTTPAQTQQQRHLRQVFSFHSSLSSCWRPWTRRLLVTGYQQAKFMTFILSVSWRSQALAGSGTSLIGNRLQSWCREALLPRHRIQAPPRLHRGGAILRAHRVRITPHTRTLRAALSRGSGFVVCPACLSGAMEKYPPGATENCPPSWRGG